MRKRERRTKTNRGRESERFIPRSIGESDIKENKKTSKTKRVRVNKQRIRSK